MSKMRIVFTAVLLTVCLAGLPNMASANPITFDFSGNVSFVDLALQTTFAEDQTITGSFTYESLTSPLSDGTFDAVSNVSFQIGSYSASATGSGLPEIQFINNNNASFLDFLILVSQVPDLVGPDVNEFPLQAFTLMLAGLNAAPGGDATTLPESLTLEAFNSAQFFLEFLAPAADLGGEGGPDDFVTLGVIGTLTQLTMPTTTTAAPVPEPTSLLLLGGGLVAAAWRRRGRKQTRAI